MNDSEHDFISSEVLTDFGKTMGQSQIDPARLRQVLASTIEQHADQADITRLRDLGAHYFVVPNDGEGFELRLGHHDLEMLNEPGAVAGEYVSLGLVKTEDIAVVPQG
ncbi:MAG TPA: hypothetical protein VGV90_06130 [Solirubrobacteraceae bacterium]|nr:hypothetical protein [Solirubrobacteraceae bacterium]